MDACQGVSSWGGVGAGVFLWETQVAPQQPGIAICFVLSGNRAAPPSCRTAPWQGWRVNAPPAAEGSDVLQIEPQIPFKNVFRVSRDSSRRENASHSHPKLPATSDP